jgi:hypothetical protein
VLLAIEEELAEEEEELLLPHRAVRPVTDSPQRCFHIKPESCLILQFYNSMSSGGPKVQVSGNFLNFFQR